MAPGATTTGQAAGAFELDAEHAEFPDGCAQMAIGARRVGL